MVDTFNVETGEEGRPLRPRGLQLPPGDEPPEDLDGISEYFLARPELAEHVKATLEQSKGGGWEHVHTFDSLEDATTETIREQFGGGRFRVRFRFGGAFVRSPMVKIAGPPLEQLGGRAAPDDARLSRLEGLVERLVERLAHAPAAGSPSADVVGLATALTAAQAPLLAALAKQDRPEGTSMAEMLDVMVRAMELGRDNNNGGGGGYGDVIKAFGPALTGLLNRAGETPGLLGPGEPLEGPGGNGEAVAAAPAGAPGWLTAFRPFLPHLLQLAAMRGDVEYWTGELVKRADDAQLEWIGAQLDRREQFEEEFYTWVPGAVPHRAWFSRLWEELDKALPGEEDPEPARDQVGGPEAAPAKGKRAKG
jgi:hypothetical protein